MYTLTGRIPYSGGSLPVRGAWIEMQAATPSVGLFRSLPVRGAWIEIFSPGMRVLPCFGSLPVRGAWIEIGKITGGTLTLAGRSPCGERGLK